MANRVVVDCLRSKVVAVQTSRGGDVRKIFQVGFLKSDGSLFVSTAYFRNSSGLLSIATIPAGKTTATISLESEGKCTSHLVKYIHHNSGEAHFSQTGKILTAIRRQSIPLRSVKGHLFTVMAQGLSHFEKATENKDFAGPSKARTNIRFALDLVVPDAIKIVGRLYDAASFGRAIVGNPPEHIGPCSPFGSGPPS
jgi:hypothetical protein